MKGKDALEILAVGLLWGVVATVGLEGAALNTLEKYTGISPVAAMNEGGFVVGMTTGPAYLKGDEVNLLTSVESAIWDRPGERKCEVYYMFGGSKDERKLVGVTCPWPWSLEAGEKQSPAATRPAGSEGAPQMRVGKEQEG